MNLTIVQKVRLMEIASEATKNKEFNQFKPYLCIEYYNCLVKELEKKDNGDTKENSSDSK